MIYEIPRNRIHLLNVATSPDYRHRGVASQMVRKLIGKIAKQQRSRIVLEVRETNLPALLFFRALGFRATNILRNFYEEMTEDAYRMQYCLPAEQQAASVPKMMFSASAPEVIGREQVIEYNET